MAQGVQAGILRLAVTVDDSSADLCRLVEARAKRRRLRDVGQSCLVALLRLLLSGV